MSQTSGSNAATYLSIGSQGRYQLGGGTLLVNSLVNQGALDGTGGNGLLVAASGSIVDLSKGTLTNAGSLSLTVGADSLLLLPAGSSTTIFHNSRTRTTQAWCIRRLVTERGCRAGVLGQSAR